MAVTMHMGVDHRVMKRSDPARRDPILEAIAREHHFPGTANPIRPGPSEAKNQVPQRTRWLLLSHWIIST